MTCYKKQADEERSKAGKAKTKDIFPKMILKKEVEPDAEEKKKQTMVFEETETQNVGERREHLVDSE